MPRMIQTMTLVRADRGRSWESQRAKPARFLLPVGQIARKGAHLLMEPKATTRPRGQREQQRQEKQL